MKIEDDDKAYHVENNITMGTKYKELQNIKK